MFALLVVSTITSVGLSLSCLIQICISPIVNPKLLFYRWLLLLVSIMSVCVNTTIMMYDCQLIDENNTTLNFICKFFRGITVLILLFISIPFISDILHASSEAQHLFYKDNCQFRRNNTNSSTTIQRKQSASTNKTDVINKTDDTKSGDKTLSTDHDHQSDQHHQNIFHRAIVEHEEMMKCMAKSCKIFGIFGVIIYLSLQILSWSLDYFITRIISIYVMSIIVILFSSCTMFHHFRVYQHMNKLHHFIETNPESDPHIVAVKFICIQSIESIFCNICIDSI